MRLPSITLAAAGNSAAQPLYNRNPFQVSLRAVVTGTVNYTVQYRIANSLIDDWIDHEDMADLTASATGTLVLPVAEVRLQYNSGTGSVTLHILQAGA